MPHIPHPIVVVGVIVLVLIMGGALWCAFYPAWINQQNRRECQTEPEQ